MSKADNIEQIADELAIRRVLEEYCLRLEVDDFDKWMNLFTDDTVYEVYKFTLRGRAEVAGLLSKAPHGLHLGGPMRIELSGDRAETVQNYLFVGQDTNEWNFGWYYRTLVRTDAGWKISHTKVKFGRKGKLEGETTDAKKT